MKTILVSQASQYEGERDLTPRDSSKGGVVRVGWCSGWVGLRAGVVRRRQLCGRCLPVSLGRVIHAISIQPEARGCLRGGTSDWLAGLLRAQRLAGQLLRRGHKERKGGTGGEK